MSSPFDSYKLDESIKKSLSLLSFTKPTEIQAKTWPLLLEGKDLIGQSKTGSGKTAAFLVPTFQKFVKKPDSQALVLVPTRELALQVEEFAKKLASRESGLRLKVALVMGGASMGMQVRALSQRPHLIVATPGRLADHLDQGTVKLGHVETLILDEADRMLDMGFYPQIRGIIAKTPKTRQSILFSATFSFAIRKLAKEFMIDPTEVTVGEENPGAPVTIDQQIIETLVTNKNAVLMDELNKRKGSVLVFARTKVRTEKVATGLYRAGYSVDVIHGDRTMGQRRGAMERFKSGEVQILVATDVAARGLDISQVEHVINFDIPDQPEDYLHRIGRTGRAGASGHAVSFITPEDRTQWRLIEKYARIHLLPYNPAERKHEKKAAPQRHEGRPAKKSNSSRGPASKKTNSRPSSGQKPSSRQKFKSRGRR